MDHTRQVELARRILEAREAGGHAPSGPAPVQNPVADYTDGEQLALERDQLFRRAAIFAGLRADAPEPGSYFTLDVVGLSLLLVRGLSGELRAFQNLCRHRGAALVEGRGRAGSHLVCPYHGWSYELDGRLAAMSERWAFEGTLPCGRGLITLPVAEQDGMIWVRPIPGDPIDLPGLLAGAGLELAGFGFGSYQRFESVELRQRMNWKLVMDTFMEQYHLPVLHCDSLAPMFLGTLALYDAFGDHGRLVAVRRSIAELETVPEADWSVLPHTTLLYFLFPNTVLIYQQDHVQSWQVFPGESVEEARMLVTLYVPEPQDSRNARSHFARNLKLLVDVTTQEDFALGERMQRGYENGCQRGVIFGRNEVALAHYHRTIRRRIGLPEDS
ncbi:MAG: SRPBCC family protein [Myxococcota bacterium]